MRIGRTMRLAGAVLALTLAAAACGGGDEGGGDGGGQVNQGASFPEGTTMARLKQAGTVKVGTKFDQPLFGL
ncbi:MAG TPA: ABC transporter substrate-binding protein, partial [Actinomycetota bacterium]